MTMTEKGRILVVGSPQLAEELCLLVQAEDFVVHRLADPSRYGDVHFEASPEVTVIDCVTPSIRGRDFLHWLRKESGLAPHPCLLVIPAGEERRLSADESVVPTRFVNMPLNQRDVIDTLRRLVITCRTMPGKVRLRSPPIETTSPSGSWDLPAAGTPAPPTAQGRSGFPTQVRMVTAPPPRGVTPPTTAPRASIPTAAGTGSVPPIVNAADTGWPSLPVAPPAPEPVPAVPTRASPKKVMVVDDDAAHSQVVKELLDFSGYEVLLSSNLRAFENAVVEKPDLILMDIQMPVLDGLMLGGILKFCPLTQHIPVIFITALTDSQLPQECKKVRAAGLIAKPVKSSQLLQTVERILKNPPAAG